MFHKVTGKPSSSELLDWLSVLCPTDSHIHVIQRGCWTDNDSFQESQVKPITTYMTVVRAFSYNGKTYWTRENWTHDNGYHCSFSEISKSRFLTLINS